MLGGALRSPERISHLATHLSSPWEKGVILAAQENTSTLTCKGRDEEGGGSSGCLPTSLPMGPQAEKVTPALSQQSQGREFCEAVWCDS